MSARKRKVADYVAACDLLVSSSRDNEGCSNSILEAMALDVPVIATDVGGNGELVQDGVADDEPAHGREQVPFRGRRVGAVGVVGDRRVSGTELRHDGVSSARERAYGSVSGGRLGGGGLAGLHAGDECG